MLYHVPQKLLQNISLFCKYKRVLPGHKGSHCFPAMHGLDFNFSIHKVQFFNYYWAAEKAQPEFFLIQHFLLHRIQQQHLKHCGKGVLNHEVYVTQYSLYLRPWENFGNVLNLVSNLDLVWGCKIWDPKSRDIIKEEINEGAGYKHVAYICSQL